MKVIGIKLPSGEELIGGLIEDLDAETLTLDRPMAMVMHRLPNNQVGTAIVPAFQSLKNDRASFVIANLPCKPWEVSEDVESEYLRATSGIELATASQVAAVKG
jgi:hypothetical protein